MKCSVDLPWNFHNIYKFIPWTNKIERFDGIKTKLTSFQLILLWDFQKNCVMLLWIPHLLILRALLCTNPNRENIVPFTFCYLLQWWAYIPTIWAEQYFYVVHFRKMVRENDLIFLFIFIDPYTRTLISLSICFSLSSHGWLVHIFT